MEFYILGAMARDAWYAKEQIGSRATRDIDFALYVFSQDQYKQILQRLTNDYGFSEMKDRGQVGGQVKVQVIKNRS